MSVISGLFKRLAAKMDNKTEAEKLLKAGTVVDRTLLAGAAARRRASRYGHPARASRCLLRALQEGVWTLQGVMDRSGRPELFKADLVTKGQMTGGPEIDIRLMATNNAISAISDEETPLMSFKAAAMEGDQYTIEVTRKDGETLTTSTQQVNGFDAVEDALCQEIDLAFNIPKAEASTALQKMTVALG
ncbi:MAG: hypothetical protein OXT65_06345 [Alphaproteobacteria bacterium]|nr:hypothetical protein [Alphaproteobacteria bacterium]